MVGVGRVGLLGRGGIGAWIGVEVGRVGGLRRGMVGLVGWLGAVGGRGRVGGGYRLGGWCNSQPPSQGLVGR